MKVRKIIAHVSPFGYYMDGLDLLIGDGSNSSIIFLKVKLKKSSILKNVHFCSGGIWSIIITFNYVFLMLIIMAIMIWLL